MEDDDQFNELFKNAILYGTGVLLMTHKENGDMDTRVVPIEEYTEVGEQMEWIQQNRKALK